MATTPTYTPTQAIYELESLIKGWAQYHANESQLAQLRGILGTFKSLIEKGQFKDKSGMVGVL